MKVYNVNTPEYLAGSEFNDIIDFISGIRQDRMTALAARYPEYTIKPRIRNTNPKQDKDLFNHLINFNIPFYDAVLCETLLHKDDCGYLDVTEFTYQLNNFSKTIFHRKKWSDHNQNDVDGFLYFVWDDWQRTQFNHEFDELTAKADELFDSCADLLEFHQKFVYNDEYKFATVDEVRELFDNLVTIGLFSGKQGDLYQIYSGVAYDDAETDAKDRYYNGKVTKMDELHIRSTYKKHVPLLLSMTSKLNVIPVGDQGTFEGMWLEHKFGGRIWFIPQFLAFYNNKVDSV